MSRIRKDWHDEHGRTLRVACGIRLNTPRHHRPAVSTYWYQKLQAAHITRFIRITKMAPIQITRVSFEHHPDGFGIGYARPRLSWRFSSDGADCTGWLQESYDIKIGASVEDDGKEYHIKSSNSVLVPWPGPDLSSRQRVWLQVRAYGMGTDLNGNRAFTSTAWSAKTLVEAALLYVSDWTAKMISSELAIGKNGPIRPVLFRRCFTLPGKVSSISKARLYITAHGLYRASVNGHRIGNEEMGPGWTSYSHRLHYQVFDITSTLNLDKPNVFGVEVAEGWFAGRLGWNDGRYHYGNKLGFLAQLEVFDEEGQMTELNSPHDWKSCYSATTRSEIYDGEDYDARLEQQGWDYDPEFDETSWTTTEEASPPSATLIASDAPPVRPIESIAPVKIWSSDAGHTLIDFGQNLTGKLEVQLSSFNGDSFEGHKLTFSHAEVLENGELCIRTLRTAKPVDSIILSKLQPETWSPKFTFHGFRYVQVDGWPDSPGLPTVDQIKAVVMHSDITRTGWFSCSDPLVNKLHENANWSMKGNFLSVPTDCPQRDERLGWTGDIQVFTPSASFLYDTSGFLKNWLADVAAEQLEDWRGGVPGMVVPDIITKRETPTNPPDPQCAWHDVTVLTPWDLYISLGDRELLRTQYASMKAWVDQGLPRGANGLWDQNVWQFGDWLDPTAPPDEPGKAATDSLLVADAYLVRVMETITKVSGVLGEAEDEARYSKEVTKVRAAFCHQYVTPAGLLASDTQTAHSLALAFGLLDNHDQIASSTDRLEHLVHLARYRIATGFVGTPLITHALSDYGHHQLAYRMLLEKSCPSWLYPITMGATTIWERWDSMLPDGSINPGTMTSFNHYALGSVVNWLHKNVAGISPLEPGWKKIKVRPVPGGTITSAEATYDSPYGRIECSWKLSESDGTFHLTLSIPPNTTAIVILPSEWRKLGQGEESGTEVGSGKHCFSCSFEQDEWPPRAKLRRSTFRLDTGSA